MNSQSFSAIGSMSSCSVTALEKERRVEGALIDLAYAKGLPLVATNEPYFATADDYEAHDALLCIAGGRLVAETDRDQLTPDHRFKTRAEMAALFADIPEALSSTIEIAERCAFRPLTRKPILPRFTVGADANTADAKSDEAAELRRQAEEGLANRLAAHGLSQGTTEEDYSDAADFELDVITRMKYPGYFLIVADFIQRAKAEGIPVGPGRVRAPAPWSPMRSRSPIWIRSGLACCSNASSIPNACRCRTSISISARSGAAKSSTTCRSATAAIRSRRSSPLERFRRAACSVMSAASCRCLTGRSTS